MKKKILVVILNDVIDTVGGAITSFNNFTNMLIENGYDVCAGFSKKKSDYTKGERENGLRLYNLKNINFEKVVKEENPDLMIFYYPRDVLKTLKKETFKNIPKILMNHTRPDFYVEYELIKDKLKDFNCVQVLFNSFEPMVKKYFKGDIVTIPNEVNIVDIQREKDKEFKNIIYLSRVDIWKGHEFLINSFSKIAKKYPEWKLNIFGQFDPKRYKKRLEKQIKKLGLENQVTLNGATKEPFKEFAKADFCVFPSYFEGFGLGLAEALSIGLPAIGLKGASGVNELIKDNDNGFLTEENEEDFAQRIEFLINNPEKRYEMGLNAKQSVKKYSKEIVAHKWLTTIENILNNQNVCSTMEENFLKYEIFPMSKIYDIMYKKRCMSFIQRIFSISNLGREKMVCVFGLKFKIKRI